MTFLTIGRGRSPPTSVPVTPAAPPPVGAPTPLLEHLAGALAPRVAGLWPAPHTDFITAPSERRHLVLIALVQAGKLALPVPGDRLLTASVKEALWVGVPGAPQGLRRALFRLGEIGWAPEDYQRLLFVLSFGEASKDVRHAPVLTPALVRALACLPEPLLRARVGGFGLDEPAARLAATAYGIIADRFGQEAAGEAVLRWSQTESPKALFEAIEDDLLPPVPAPPFAGTARLKPLTSRPDIRRAAARYENCARDLIPSVTHGRSALYEWTDRPTVMVELAKDDIFGWRLNQARRVRNETVPQSTREAITADLKAMGVHVGFTGHQLQWALESAQTGAAWFPDDVHDVQWMFGA